MKLHELKENKDLGKAGCIPYTIDGEEIRMAFMISSDAMYGGADPMIAKGHVDEGETAQQAALREAQEELGLRTTNIVDGTLQLGWSGKLRGQISSYKFDVYICQVDDIVDFDDPHYETLEVVWFTLEEFKKKGRKSQLEIVQACHNEIKSANEV